MDYCKSKEGLVEIYSQLVELIGFENTKIIYTALKGQQVVFPMRLYKKEYVIKDVKSRYDGTNLKQLASEYGYTERYLRDFLKVK